MISFFIAFVRFIKALKESFNDPEFKGFFLFVLLILTTGTVFYTTVEGWRILDSLYFSITTLTTIGFGDLTPVTDLGKLFTIIYIFVGVGIILGFINIIATHANKQNPINKFIKK